MQSLFCELVQAIMDDATPWLLLAFSLSVSFTGIFLAITLGTKSHSPVRQYVGTVLFVFSLFLLVVSIGLKQQWWPKSRLDSVWISGLFLLSAIASTTSAMLAVTAKSIERTCLFFSVTLVSNALLFTLQKAYWPAALTIFAGIGFATAVTWKPCRERIRHVFAAESQPAGEPLLCCLVGWLFATLLIGTMHNTFAVEARRTAQASATQSTGHRHFSATPDPKRIRATLQSRSPQQLIDNKQPSNSGFFNALFQEQWMSIATIVVLASVAVTFSVRTSQQSEP